MTPSRKVLCLALVLAFAALAGAASAQSDPRVEMRLAIAEVAETTGDLAFSLEQFSRAVGGESSSCGERPETVLAQANAEGSLLETRIRRLESILSTATPEEGFLAANAISQARARLGALGDSLLWSPIGNGDPAVTWCGGWVNCMILKTACEGCFKCYVGLIDCGCFVPCP